jgi:hypothetical protein
MLGKDVAAKADRGLETAGRVAVLHSQGQRLYRVAPGFRFRDHDNRIMVPVPPAIRGKVAFTRDTMGQVLGLWLLTPREIAAFEARLKSR